ncbi:hypothetical protein GCM10023089_00270 [Quisquiliibacterium transsilvanicum]|uniref:Uncharacterized protein n=1 Tax=Quisquiliibacterium transsilvanicum TaxID=1549638 RepID=A0A7W8M802_9BURK|nr:hypothetical protein [Quisquiliibacterium transsilvanicum]MBB5271318.1 hypothetical protein [Quisquiliibacterium transsilvanicum]
MLDPLAALRQAERIAVDHPVRPSIAEALELVHDCAHRATAPELEHERHVLDDDPWHWTAARLSVFDQTEHLANQAASMPGQPGSPAGLAQILTREARGDQVDRGRQTVVGDDIVDQLGAVEPRAKHGLSCRQDLAKHLRLMSRLRQAQLEPTDAGEQSCNFHASLYL